MNTDSTVAILAIDIKRGTIYPPPVNGIIGRKVINYTLWAQAGYPCQHCGIKAGH